MEITESQLSTSLQEAFTYYLAFLSHSKILQDTKLPRRGKGVETPADLSNQRSHQIRVAAGETCLQYTGRIARRVRRWHTHHDRDLEEPGNDDTANVEVDVEVLRPFLEAFPEESFVDPLSGRWIETTNASSAGPSPSSDEAASHLAEDLTGSKVQQRPTLQRQQPYQEIAHNYLETKARSRRTRFSLRPSLGLHPNIPISPLLPSLSPESRTSSERSSATDAETILTPNSSVSSHETKPTRQTPEMVSTYHQPHKRDKEFVKQLEAHEKHRKEQAERGYAEAKRLSERIAREEQLRLEKSERYARDLERKERENEERIRRDREAAQKVQERWLLETTAREAEAKKRSEERRRREREEERKRKDAEEKRRTESEKKVREHEVKRTPESEKKVRFGRERTSPEIVKRRSPSVSDEKRRQEARNALRDQERVKRRSSSVSDEKKRREAHNTLEEYRKKKDAEKKDRESKPKKVDCVSCMEPGVKKEMAVLPCEHAYCSECISAAFNSALKSHTPFKCCGKSIRPPTILPPSLTKKYNHLLLELSTKNPTYCSSPTCSTFLPPSSIHGPIGTCPSCKVRTCLACKKNEHKGVCKEDKEGKKVEELARKKGWKQCPNCSQILERTEGCLHMTCRCRAEWCYACLRDWEVCKSTCGRSGAANRGGVGLDFMGARNGVDDGVFVDRGVGGDDFIRRLLEQGFAQRNQRAEAEATGGQEREIEGMGLLPAVGLGLGLMMAMFDT